MNMKSRSNLNEKKLLPTQEELLRYLKDSSLLTNMPLVSSEALSFHWANWSESCQFQKNYLFDNAKSCERYFDLNQAVDSYKQVPVWMKNRQKTIQSNLFDLYQCYSDSRIRSTWFDREEEILVSTTQESGPYITLSSMRWMDKSIYSQFVYRKILTQHMPLRGFRLSSKIPVQVSFDASPLKTATFNIHQISEHGLLFYIRGHHFFNLMEQSEKLSFNINLRPFLEVSHAGVQETLHRLEQQDFYLVNPENDKLTTISIHSNVLDKYDNKKNFRLSANDEFYLFVKFKDMNNESNSIRLKKLFKSLVTKFEHQFNEILKQSA